jgi:hypothetical protein
LREFLVVGLLALKTISFKLFKGFVQRILYKLTLWEHKRLYSFVFYFFKFFLFFRFTNYDIRFIKLRIKGKLGLSGNARKRVKYLSLHNDKFNNLAYVKAYFLNESFITTSGSVGFLVWILFS